MTSPAEFADELLKHRQQLEPLLEISPSAIVITDLASNVISWNPAAEELFGYTAEESIGRNLDDLVAPTDELHQAAVSYSERARGKEQIRTVTRRTRKDGTLVDVEVRAAPLLADGKPIGTFGIYHDVTELHRQRRFYEALLEVSPAAVVAIDPKDNVTLWNPAAERLFGYTPAEAIGRKVDDLVAREREIRGEAEALNRTAEGGQIRTITRRTRKDGSLIDVELLGAPVMIGDELVGRYAIYLDISELQRRKLYYEALVELSPTAVATVDPNDIITSWNPAAERMFGFTAEEAIGRNIDDLVANRGDVRGEGLRVSKEIEDHQMQLITRRTRKDGSLIDVSMTAAAIRLGGELVGKYALYNDISEPQEQKRFFQALVDLSPTAIVTVDEENLVTRWNPAAQSLFGYTSDEAVGRDLDLLVGRVDQIRDEAQRFTEQMARGDQVRAISRRTRKDGSLIDVEMLETPVLIGGERLGHLVIYHDITEIQRQKRYYEALLEVSPTAIVTVDLGGKVASWNPAAERMFGYLPEEAIGRDIDDLVAGSLELRAEAIRLSQEGRAKHIQTGAITRRARKDGSLIDVEVAGVPVLVGGEWVGDFVIYHDISEIQEQKRYLESLLELSPTAIVVIDKDGRVTSWNPGAKEIFRYTAQEAVGQFLDDLVAKRPDLHEEGARFTEAALRGERVHAFARRTRKDGSLVDVELISQQMLVGDRSHGFIAIYHDISELQRQRRYFEAVLQLSPTAIVTVDEQFRVTSWNPTAEELFGYSQEEAIGRPIDDLVANSPDLRDEAAAMNQAGARGERARMIGRRTRKDGSLIDVEIVAGPVYVAGERVGHSVIYHDISELQRQKRYYEALVEVSPVAVVLMDNEGIITSWSPAAERLFGYASKEAIGRDIKDVVTADPTQREEAGRFLRQMQEGAETFHAITRRAPKDGSPIDVEIFTAPVRIGHERVGFYVLYHDISELQRARLEAEAATAAKSAFLATMSHEIRTPLNAVIGMTGLLLDTELTDEQRGFGEVIRTSGDALLVVINEILDFSKIEAGRVDLERQPFRLRECLESALDLVATAASEKSLDLAYVIDPRTPASIVGDFTRVRQILLNLLNNAVKFTERGEVVLRVEAAPVGAAGEVGGDRYEVHFSVRDTGIGIPEDRMDRLFEAFTQVDASTTRRYGGTGLGLAICKRLAEEMGGRLWATSRVGQGSMFHVTIVAEAIAGPVAAEEIEAVPELGGKRVLIVDDNGTNREILRRQTVSWGMVPLEAASPSEALGYVRRGDPFDLAILDMQMPQMDGVALAKEIRRNGTMESVPLVMLTSIGRRDSSASTGDFAALLTKPIRPSQLYDTLVGIFSPRMAPQKVARRETPVAGTTQQPHLRILLAEDNAVNQRVALLLLEKLGYRADIASNGREALQALERQHYDLVLMDVQMPEMDGLEATRHILERWPGPDRPRIIAMTAGATEADRDACLAAGMDDYVSKPIRQNELAAALAGSDPRRRMHEGVDGTDQDRMDAVALDRLRETVGGEEALGEVMTTFFQDTERILGELRQDVLAGRAAEVRRHAHSLKSTAASFGASRLAGLCRRLEEMARAERLDGAASLVQDISTEFAWVRDALRARSGR